MKSGFRFLIYSFKPIFSRMRFWSISFASLCAFVCELTIGICYFIFFLIEFLTFFILLNDLKCFIIDIFPSFFILFFSFFIASNRT